MDKKIAEVIDQGLPPTRADIAGILSIIGAPGKKREQKQAAIRKLYDESGHSAHNLQAIHVADALESYSEY